ncbi:MAG TPA: DUF2225 domain-containing protein [Desulfomonilaceae bacterium]|nr:DUF2225 domain-containing protein [Desulfomonilaceae bacterium]
MSNSETVLACPLCYTHFSHVRNMDCANVTVFGFGLDFRVIPRDCNRSSDIATCPDCLFTSRTQDFRKRVPGNVKDLVRSAKYREIFEIQEEVPARSWPALIAVLDSRGLNPRDLGIMSLKGSWVARELGCLKTEEELLRKSDSYLEDALRRGLTKGDPGMVMYLLGEINRRRGEFLRSREMLTFLGNNPRYRYPALLLTVLIEEEDCTPYWTHHSPDVMEQHSPRFKGLFPALRSIPPRKTEFSADELREQTERSDEDDRRLF